MSCMEDIDTACVTKNQQAHHCQASLLPHRAACCKTFDLRSGSGTESGGSRRGRCLESEMCWQRRRWLQHGSKLGWFPEATLWEYLDSPRWTGPLLTWLAPTGQQLAPLQRITPSILGGMRTRILLYSFTSAEHLSFSRSIHSKLTDGR